MNNFVVSARKYRPSTFDMVVGQPHITQTLKNAIRNKHLAQAFLFCGPRGVGKTTCARILAKTLNCHNLTDQIEACNECESCLSFNSGQSLNIYELDAASNNSVDDIRALVEQVRYAPHSGEYKIYIIDEVHMLSAGAFNAFLKTLEEPPSYAVFILATTEKHKIIPTILSRCQIFDFSRIQVEDIASHLAYVSEKENVTADADALHIIAQKADGALRDALSIFDQMVSFAGNNVTYKDVINNLSILDYDYFFKITDNIREGNIASVLLTFNELLIEGFDAHHFINGLAGHFRDLLVCQDPSTVQLLEVSKNIRNRYLQQAKQTSPALLLTLLELCSKCDISYRAARNQRLHVELTLIKMCSLTVAFSGSESLNVPGKSGSDIETANKGATEKKSIDVNPLAKKPETAKDKSPSNIVDNTTATSTPKIKISTLANTSDVIPVQQVAQNVKPSYSSVLKKTSLAGAGQNVVKEPEQDKTPTEKKVNLVSNPVDQEQLEKVWNEFAAMEKAAGKHQLFSTLTHRKPKLISNDLIELEIMNLPQENLLNEEKKTLMDYLRLKLNNDKIQFQIKLIDIPKEETVYTTKEKYQKMVERNPALEEMRKKLGLELDI